MSEKNIILNIIEKHYPMIQSILKIQKFTYNNEFHNIPKTCNTVPYEKEIVEKLV